MEKDFKVVAQCATGDEALMAVRKHRPDILVIDMRMPGKNGLAVIREMNQERLHTRVVVLAAELSDSDALEVTRLGVPGVVLKEMAPKKLVQCIRKVHDGERWFERACLNKALEKLVEHDTAQRAVFEMLTRREVEILRMVTGGLRNKEIGKKLFISEGTVKVHLHAIYEKFNVPSRHALTVYARDKGLA